MQQLLRDVQFAWRASRRNPGLTAVILFSLSLSVGAGTAIFSITDAMLLRPLDYPEPDRLVDIWLRTPNLGIPRDWLSPGEYIDLKTQTNVFSGMAIALGDSFNVTGIGTPERVEGMRTSSALFQLLGARTLSGRIFGAEADRPGGSNVAVLTEGIWKRLFSADPNILGRAVTINGRPFTVVAVLRADSMRNAEAVPPSGGVGNPEIFIPLPLGEEAVNNRWEENYNVVARLAPGVSLEQAQAAVSTVASRIREKDRRDRTFSMYLIPLFEQAVGSARPVVLLLLGAVACVLLIACANVANLLLARASVRQKEAAVRVAVGCGPGRLLAQLLTESVAIGLAGGAGGLALAWGLLRLLRLLPPVNIPRMDEVAVNGAALAFTVAVSTGTGILFGLAPALRISGSDLASFLKSGGRTAGSGGGSDRLRGVLVVLEIALSTVLLIGAGLLVRSFTELERVPPGFDPEGVASLRVSLRGLKYREGSDVSGFFRRLREAAGRAPGIAGLAAVSALPMAGSSGWGGLEVEGYLPRAGEPELQVDIRSATPGYLGVMRIPLLSGRDFSERDAADSPGVVLVDEKMARRFWPDRSPLGRRVRFSGGSSPWLEVVGLVRTVKQEGLDSDTRPAVYFPHTQVTMQTMFVVARTANPAEITRAIHGIDPELPVYGVATMGDVVWKSLARQRFAMLVLGAFACFAALLAAVGVYGVMSYLVTRSTHDIGIRMALGAAPADILAMVLQRGLLLTVSGLLLGLVLAAVLTRLMGSLLFGVRPADPMTFAAVTVFLLVVALAASYVPAARAAALDPVRALQE